ncbi:MAG: hypothetical protein ACD_78C00464G0001, partial [uncultured bacterium (gcode 4)]
MLQDNFISSFDISEKITFTACYEHNSLSFRTSSTSTTDSVNICFRIFRYIIIHNKGNIFHIESTCRNIGRDEDITKPILK